MYLNYVKSGYFVMVTMHTQGLKSFAHALVRCFLLENTRQLYQKKNHSHTLDIDGLKVFRNQYFEGEIVLKTKKKYKCLTDKINNKITKLRCNKMLKKLKEKVEKKIDLINKLIISKLKIYVDDSVSEVDELNKIDAKIDATADEALNVICNMMCKKNRKILI